MIRIYCPKCGHTITVPIALSDTIDNCTQCGNPEITKLKVSGSGCMDC